MNGIQADSRSEGFSSFSFQKRKVSQIIMKTTNEISFKHGVVYHWFRGSWRAIMKRYHDVTSKKIQVAPIPIIPI
mgnify:FL=1